LDKDLIIQELVYKIEELVREVQFLKQRLSKYEHPKNSNNSSDPPSKDENRPKRNQSLRQKTGLKPGGQPGHKGNTLKMVEQPDITQEHKPYYCNCCGQNISDIPFVLAGKRQVMDIPEFKISVTEHQIFSRVCTCGHETTSKYPL